ncbi:MAG: hypothetical protein KJN73_03980 [Acidimicrobiia bacterium]|nr:hypothetical protein [Acidimicrobiia bacterium]
MLTKEFMPADQLVEATSADGDDVKVQVEDLKAVFFLKDPLRRDAELHIGEAADQSRGGAVATVEFFDGEVIKGRMSSYSVADSGFFLYPTSVESNNERIFVVARSMQTLSIEG